MTQKEKAYELVQKMRVHSPVWEIEGDAKQCALIAVDETLCILSDLCCDFGGNDIIEKEIAYWKQVKHELNKSE